MYPHSRRCLRRLGAALTLGVLAGVTPLAAAPAFAGHVSCGDTVTRSVTLHADLNCGAFGPGLAVGASGITIDLNGHTITAAVPISNNGHDFVTVRRGTLETTSTGVLWQAADHGRLRGLTITGDPNFNIPSQGIDLLVSNHTLVRGVHVSNALQGISVRGNRNVVRANTVTSTQIAIVVTAILAEPVANRVEDNLITGNFTGIGVFESRQTKVAGNRVRNNLDYGIFVESLAQGTTVKGNAANRNGTLNPDGDGIRVDAAATTITLNIARNNADYGIQAVDGVTDGGGNRASGNGNPAQCVAVACTP